MMAMDEDFKDRRKSSCGNCLPQRKFTHVAQPKGEDAHEVYL